MESDNNNLPRPLSIRFHYQSCDRARDLPQAGASTRAQADIPRGAGAGPPVGQGHYLPLPPVFTSQAAPWHDGTLSSQNPDVTPTFSGFPGTAHGP